MQKFRGASLACWLVVPTFVTAGVSAGIESSIQAANGTSADQYFSSRGLLSHPAIRRLLEVDASEWPAMLRGAGVPVPGMPLSTASADLTVGRWLIANGDSSGAALVLRSGLASEAEIYEALGRITAESVVVERAAVRDLGEVRSGTVDELEYGAYLQGLVELLGPSMYRLLPEFNSFEILWRQGFFPELVLRVTPVGVGRAQELLSRSSALTSIRVVAVAMSERDIARAMRTLAAHAQDSSEFADAVSHVSTGGTYDRIVLHPSSAEGARETLELAIVDDPELRTLARAGMLGIGEVRPEASLTLDAFGGILSTTCTWGFNVDRLGVAGLMTAGHCSSSQDYFGTALPMIAGSEVQNTAADVQVHSLAGGLTPTNDIRAGANDYRDINVRVSYSGIALGAGVCHAGKTTGYSCGTVTDKTGGTSFDNYFIEVTGGSIDHGDSGGPYFFGRSAYGICHAMASPSVGYFGAANLAEDWSNSVIRTK